MKARYITIITAVLLLFGIAAVTSIEADDIDSSIVVLSDKNYKSEVTDYKGIVLVDFWAPWCGPCRKMAPILAEYAEEKKAELKVGKINAEVYKKFVIQQGIEMLPTLIIYKDGVEIGRIVGALNREELNTFVQGKINTPAQ